MTKWTYDYEKYEMDPDDGDEPFVFWWEDMRPREVRELIKEAYERGVNAGKKESNDVR